MPDLARQCKRCKNPLGDGVYTCPKCGQLNPTSEYAIAVSVIITLIVLIFIWFITKTQGG